MQKLKELSNTRSSDTYGKLLSIWPNKARMLSVFKAPKATLIITRIPKIGPKFRFVIHCNILKTVILHIPGLPPPRIEMKKPQSLHFLLPSKLLFFLMAAKLGNIALCYSWKFDAELYIKGPWIPRHIRPASWSLGSGLGVLGKNKTKSLARHNSFWEISSKFVQLRKTFYPHFCWVVSFHSAFA